MSPLDAATLQPWRSTSLARHLIAPLLEPRRELVPGMSAQPLDSLDIKGVAHAQTTIYEDAGSRTKRLLTQAEAVTRPLDLFLRNCLLLN